MKIVTWNVNSIRSRLEYVLNWLDENQPDVLCLQETKVQNHEFPAEPFTSKGWHVTVHGQKSYNGVAFISKTKPQNVVTGFAGEDLNNHARIITGTFSNIKIMNLYIPQGESVDSPKFEFKEQFYAEILTDLTANYSPTENLVLCGDFNIAPTKLDIDDLEKRADKCMFTKQEHGWLAELEDWGLTEAYRHKYPNEIHFSWWDYRHLALQKNRGLRIDLFYITTPLIPKIESVKFYKEERKREKPSDHIPVMLELK